MSGGVGTKLSWVAMALGLAVLCVVFRHEAAAAVAVWRSSTAYGHCWLVLPIVVWLLWERRGVFSVLKPKPALLPLVFAAPLVPAWLAAFWLGIMEGRQLAALGFAEVLLLAGLGWRMWWALSAGLLYLVFLVPFGAFVTPALQHFTASFIVGGLRLLHIPFEADAFQITIPEGSFFVAEACAGLRFLIAAIAFGVLYAVTMFRSPLRRAAFIAVSCVVPVVANGFRGLGIVLLGHVLGSAQAGAADHLIYGWVFFSAVILLLAAAGLPFREAPSGLPAPDTGQDAAPGWGLVGGLGVVLLAAAAPAVSATVFARPAMLAAGVTPFFSPPASCTGAGAQSKGPVRAEAFVCGSQRVTITSIVVPRGSNPAQILETARADAAAGLLGEVDTQAVRIGGAPWMMMTGRDLGGVSAYAIWVDGRQMVGSVRDRLQMARDMFSAGRPPVAVTVAVAPGKAGAQEILMDVLPKILLPK